MTTRTAPVKAAPPKPPGRVSLAAKRRQEHMARAVAPYVAGLAVTAVAALVLRLPGLLWFAAGGVIVHVAIRLHEAHGWHRGGGKAAMRKHRKYQGTATRRELRRNLSPAAARKRAAVVSPGLHPSQAAVVIGRAKGQDLAGSREDSYLLVAPPRVGKTGMMACWAADAPGALLATSTRTDLYAHTAIPRARLGDILTLNPGGDGGIPSTLAWSPLDGCQSPPSRSSGPGT